jgi:predicted amidophosphoribosyltransferase
MLNKFLDFVAPVSCQVCGVAGVLCCTSHFDQPEPIADSVDGIAGFYALELDDRLLKVFAALKDRSITALAKDLSEIAQPLTKTTPWLSADLAVHPPSSRSAYRKRGFVPTRLILNKLKQPLEIGRLTLVRQPIDQRKLNAHQRAENLVGAFSSAPLAGRSVVLFDDVMTTSATIQEMARAVTQAGGVVTGFCVIARRLLESDPQLANQA